MKKSTMVALGCGAGAVACIALAVHFKKRRQTGGAVACGVVGGCAAAVAAGCTVCALRKRDALRLEDSEMMRERGQVQQMKLEPMAFSGEPASAESQYKELSKQGNPIVGDKVGDERYVGEMSGNEDFKVIKNFDFKQHRFPIPVEGIGVNSSAVFSLTSTLSNRSLEIFASGWFVGKNLVDSYQLFGGATLVVNGINLGRQPFVIPTYNYISKGYPYQTIGEASFFHLFTKKDKVHLVLDLWLRTEVDMRFNDGFWQYPDKKVVIQ